MMKKGPKQFLEQVTSKLNLTLCNFNQWRNTISKQGGLLEDQDKWYYFVSIQFKTMVVGEPRFPYDPSFIREPRFPYDPSLTNTYVFCGH